MRTCTAVLVLVLHAAQGQYRQPPGVNPAHYEAPGQVPQQQFQQVPQQGVPQQQFQQVPHQQGVPQQQFQQVPQQQGVPQQQFQQVPQQQGVPQQQFQQVPQQGQPAAHQAGVPQQQVHGTGHGGHGQQQAILRDKQKIQAEKEHIKEHLGAPMDTSGMSEEELQFHYFKMHDADGNNKLDGLELVASLQHWHEDTGNGAQQLPPAPAYPEWKIVEMVDLTLLDADVNKDGFVSWAEFLTSSRT